jgi:DNA polymerase-3 subunit delta'
MGSVWDEVSGQPHVVNLLASEAQDPSDAYLFVGPRGVGKVASAMAFASAMLCDEHGCGTCSVCQRIQRGVHPDVHVNDPEGFTFSVSAIREIAREATQTPLEASNSVFVIRESDRIEEASQSSLLKALEEPVRSVTWVLIAESMDRFLPTVLSRCRVIQFAGVGEPDLKAKLEGDGVSASDADWIARAARGDLEMARSLATDPRARTIRDLAISVVSRLDTTARVLATMDELASIAEAVVAKLEESHTATLNEFDEAMGSGRGTAGVRKRVTDRHRREIRRAETEVYLDFLGWIGNAYRDLALLSRAGSAAAVTSPDALGSLEAAAPAVDTAAWLRLSEQVQEARLAIYENANAPLAVESALLGHVGEMAAVGTSPG